MKFKKILIVDDDEGILDVMASMLTSEGYTVECAANGAAALGRLNTYTEPCFILLDMMMPVMDGKEFLAEHRKLKTESVVYVHSATSSNKEAQELGANGFLAKPSGMDAILGIVQEFCEKADPVEKVSDLISDAMDRINPERITDRQRLEANKPIILAKLKELGAVEAIANYNGSGDSGCVESVEAYAKPTEEGVAQGSLIPLEGLTISLAQSSSVFNEVEQKWDYLTVHKEMSLEDALIDFAQDFIGDHFPGWVDNDGAYGTVTFKVSEDKIEMDHNERYTSYNNYVETI